MGRKWFRIIPRAARTRFSGKVEKDRDYRCFESPKILLNVGTPITDARSRIGWEREPLDQSWTNLEEDITALAPLNHAGLRSTRRLSLSCCSLDGHRNKCARFPALFFLGPVRIVVEDLRVTLSSLLLFVADLGNFFPLQILHRLKNSEQARPTEIQSLKFSPPPPPAKWQSQLMPHHRGGGVVTLLATMDNSRFTVEEVPSRPTVKCDDVIGLEARQGAFEYSQILLELDAKMEYPAGYQLDPREFGGGE
ncbi:hypothetical protein B0H11DRAFT_2189716 [Mycena galericulata]|nr:hypothetical protein B0H11DRAFT_2189716 [Mycena galericulata]